MADEKIDDGGPAFPTTTYDQSAAINAGIGVSVTDTPGLLIRDYFAAKALNAVVLHTDMTEEGSFEKVSRRAYQIADAMLKARGAR